MARSFDSIDAFAAHVARVIEGIPAAERRAIEAGSAAFLDAVKAIPGRYQDGWPALAEATREDRVAKGFTPDDPLRRTGGFADSFEREVTGNRTAVVGTTDPRGQAFEYGTRTMPARPVLAAAEAQQGERIAHLMASIIHDHISGRAAED